MTENKLKPTLLRLRSSTVEALKLELARSSHRSMASLADEILEKELTRRLEGHGTQLDRMVEAARRGM